MVRDDHNRLYMYAAEMVGECGIGSWTRNSRVILASAANASAPFRFEKELWGSLLGKTLPEGITGSIIKHSIEGDNIGG